MSRNAVSESDTNTIQELQELKDSMNKNNQIENQKKSDSEATLHHQLTENLELKSHTLIKQYDCTIEINH